MGYSSSTNLHALSRRGFRRGFWLCAVWALVAACNSSYPDSLRPESEDYPPPFVDIAPFRYRDGIEPVAKAADFDDTSWESVSDLQTSRGPGGVSFGWYRATIIIPDQIAGIPSRGRLMQISVLADDYAEVYLDGTFATRFEAERSPRSNENANLGYEIAGFNKANVIDLGRRNPGESLTMAILVANGPLAEPQGGYFLRHARLQLVP